MKAESEGVIRFHYQLEERCEPVLPSRTLDELRAWREIMRRLGLLGQRPDRYQGLGFGNISVRCPQRSAEFVITATQTSGVDVLEDRHLTRVRDHDLTEFRVTAAGPLPPSSESLTHAMIYQLTDGVDAIVHVHSPEIWHRADAIGLPTTPEQVSYGSPAMAQATRKLLEEHRERPLSFATLGHGDGVCACAASVAAAAAALVDQLSRALRA